MCPLHVHHRRMQDDGGGFFTAWEAIRLIKSLQLHTNRTIRAIGWVDEENEGAGASQYAVDYGDTFVNTSFCMESDTGEVSPLLSIEV